jgi:hypothetical protein
VAIFILIGCQNKDNAEIIKTVQNKLMTDNLHFENINIEKIKNNFSRVYVIFGKGAQPAWFYLEKKENAWKVITYGTGLVKEDFESYGIPKSVR